MAHYLSFLVTKIRTLPDKKYVRFKMFHIHWLQMKKYKGTSYSYKPFLSCCLTYLSSVTTYFSSVFGSYSCFTVCLIIFIFHIVLILICEK